MTPLYQALSYPDCYRRDDNPIVSYPVVVEASVDGIRSRDFVERVRLNQLSCRPR